MMIEKLKIGDYIVIKSGRSSSEDMLGRYARETATQHCVHVAVTDSEGVTRNVELKFWKKSLREVGTSTSYFQRSMHKATEAEVNSIREKRKRAHLLKRINRTTFNDFSTEVLSDICAILTYAKHANERGHDND